MATLPTPPTGLTPEQLLLGHLELIKKVAAHACRGKRFSREDTEEFTSDVKIKLIEDDYAVIRKFQGRSSFRTYVTVVVNHFFQDHCNAKWGKWRPSAEAERLGPHAVKLETLRVRDGHTFDEACEILRVNEHVEASRAELEALAARLPPRNPPRRMQGEEELRDRPAADESPAERLEHQEAAARKWEIEALLEEALTTLPPDDALIARMLGRFTVAQIAKIRGLRQKPLYPRIAKILEKLKRYLTERGVHREEIAEILAAGARGR